MLGCCFVGSSVAQRVPLITCYKPHSTLSTVSISTTSTPIETVSSTSTSNYHNKEALEPRREKYWLEECLLKHANCVCNYEDARLDWIDGSCETGWYYPVCWMKEPKIGDFCRKGAENGPPAITIDQNTGEVKHNSKSRGTCGIDGVSWDDCEPGTAHMEVAPVPSVVQIGKKRRRQEK